MILICQKTKKTLSTQLEGKRKGSSRNVSKVSEVAGSQCNFIFLWNQGKIMETNYWREENEIFLHSPSPVMPSDPLSVHLLERLHNPTIPDQ